MYFIGRFVLNFFVFLISDFFIVFFFIDYGCISDGIIIYINVFICILEYRFVYFLVVFDFFFLLGYIKDEVIGSI